MNGSRANKGDQRSGDIRMKDLSDYLGLSIATISRAMNNPERVSIEKRKLIEDAIARLNYRPNLAARTLRRRESRTILIIFPDLSPFFLDVFRGAERAAGELGFTAMMGHCNRNSTRERMFLNQALSGRADGIVLVTSSNDAQLSTITNLPPLVMMMEPGSGRTFPTVAIDHRDAAMTATRHLVALGHRRIAHITGAPSQMATDRLEGFRAAIAEAGLDSRTCYVVPGDFTIAGGEGAMERLITRHPRPTAVFAANDEMAVGAMQAIKREGLGIGTDISVIGFDDQRIASLYEPKLTTIHVPMADLGYEAVMLLRRVIQRDDDCHDITLGTRLVERATTGPPIAASDETLTAVLR